MKKSESSDYSMSKLNAVSSCSTEQPLSHVSSWNWRFHSQGWAGQSSWLL